MSNHKNRTAGRTLRVYKSYNFIDKDPIIDHARTAFQRSGKSLKQIEAASGVSYNTVHAWFHKKTKRPQFATVAAVMLACGVRTLDLDKIRKL